jgi:hypothetical protein
MHDHDYDVESPAGHHVQARSDREEDGYAAGPAAQAGQWQAVSPSAMLGLQRSAGNAGVRGALHRDEEESPVHGVIRQSGEPLDPGVRRSMEAALGHDFGDVQVHHDSGAGESAKSVQAHAYTVGNHVVFGDGRYQPDTADGQRTLAHELTHVVQQRQGPVDGEPAAGGVRVSHPDDRFEREADRAADGVMSGPGVTAQRQAEGEIEEEEEPEVSKLDVQRQEAPEEEEESVTTE